MSTPPHPGGKSPFSTVMEDDYAISSESASLMGADRSPRQSRSNHVRYNPLYVTVVASLIFLIVDIVGNIAVAPRLAIVERIICDEYYSRMQMGEHPGMSWDCKVEPVQSELALINGWRETFDNIPGLIVCMPFGILADWYGRKPVLLLAMVGCFLSDVWVGFVTWFPQFFPLRAVWLSGLWQLLGGGGASISSMSFTMIADLCPAEMRTTAFSQVHAAVLVSELISVPTGAALMGLNPWIPIFGASTLMALGILLAWVLVPDIVPKPALSTDIESSSEDHSETDISDASAFSRLQAYITKTLQQITHECTWIRNPNILLVLSSFFVCQLGRQITSITLQYAAAKFRWQFNKASLLVSLRAGVNLFVLAAVIPGFSYLLVKRLRYEDALKDKRLTQLNGICLILGSAIIFLAGSPPTLVFGQTIFALGFAFDVTARSFLTGMVDPMHLGTVYTGVTTMLYGGLMIGSPILAKALQWGLQLGGSWVGLPFLVAAVLFTFALGAITAATL